MNIGVAAHITAAAPGGPRYEAGLTPSQRSDVTNGIWLCQNCAKLIDSDVQRFTKDVLVNWKSTAEARAQSLIQTPRRPQDADELSLELPTTDATASWLSFSARATNMIGRDAELSALQDFLLSGAKFTWWLLSGAGGTGKSRLALELCHQMLPAWHAGFLSRTQHFATWSHFRPGRPTLVVIDYVASRVSAMSDVVLQLARSSAHFPNPVRVLLIERDQGSWWPRFLREESQSESTDLRTSLHDPEPLHLEGIPSECLQALAADVARSQGIEWTATMARQFDVRMRTLDPLGRPLFAMMAAAYSAREAGNAALDNGMLRLVLAKEAGRRRLAIPDDERLLRLENLIVLGTLVGGLLPKEGGFAFLADVNVASFLPDPHLLDVNAYLNVVGASSDATTLPGLQPDILGERFVLDHLMASGHQLAIVKRLFQAAWELQPDGVVDFLIRAAADFPDDPALEVVCEVPKDRPESRERWARLVADLVRVANRSNNRRTQRLIDDLRVMAATYPAEAPLQAALAWAEFYLGNVFLFTEGDHVRALAQYDAVMAHVGPESDVGAATMNNRGILHSHMEEEEQAFAAWSSVIAQHGIPDEARACSLNNRADIHARRGRHDLAIADRSVVLELGNTSPDRRYIALVRRSESYEQLGRVADALRDLDRVLDTDDISPRQKAEARVARGQIAKSMGRLSDARQDFDSVLAEEELFSGTAGTALVGLADLARREGDVKRSREYVDMALASLAIVEDTRIEAIGVLKQLSEDESNR